MSYAYISRRDKTKESLAELAKESTTAFTLLMYLMIESDENLGKHQIAYENYERMGAYLSKSKETVRVALNILRKRKLISEEYDKKCNMFLIEVLINK